MNERRRQLAVWGVVLMSLVALLLALVQPKSFPPVALVEESLQSPMDEQTGSEVVHRGPAHEEANPGTPQGEPDRREGRVGEDHGEAEGVDGLPLAAAEFLEDLARSSEPGKATTAGIRRAVFEVMLAGQQWAKSARTATDVPELGARVFDFPADANTAAYLSARLAEALQVHLPPDEAIKLLAAWERAAEEEPSMDGLRHRRQITILPSSEGSRWQVLDRTFTEEGDLVAGKSVLLGIDEDEHLVWPPEYELLLSE